MAGKRYNFSFPPSQMEDKVGPSCKFQVGEKDREKATKKKNFLLTSFPSVEKKSCRVN